MGKLFQKNEGGLDRAVRIILGIILIALVFVGPKSPWCWIGLILLLTGLLGSCPLYSVLGFSTRSAEKK